MIMHAGTAGRIRLRAEPDQTVASVYDRGYLYDPLIARHAPAAGQRHGQGLLLADRLADLATIRFGQAGATIWPHFGDRVQLRARPLSVTSPDHA